MLRGLLLLLLTATEIVWGCPPSVRAAGASAYLPPNYPSLCALADAYANVLDRLRAAGVETPLNLTNVIAPRLIRLDDWIGVLESSRDTNAWTVYPPQPETWGAWARAARIVQDAPAEPLTLAYVQKLNHAITDFMRLPTGWRETEIEIGRAWEQAAAPRFDRRRNVNAIEYGGERLLEWHDTQCLEDRDAKFRSRYARERDRYSTLEHWPDRPPEPFLDPAGHERQCGYVVYPASKRVPAALEKWLNIITTWRGDLILKAARAERWLVAIHPFEAGNGRVARLVMDKILVEAGLPAPILADMDDDLYRTEDEWAREVGEGMARTIQVLERCLRAPGTRGCAPVNTAPIHPCSIGGANACWEAGPCNGRDLCEGDETIVKRGSAWRRGRVTHAYPAGQVDVFGRTYELDAAAVTHPDSCWRVTTPYCVGRRTRRAGRDGRLVGYFPVSGDLLLDEGGLKRAPRKNVRVFANKQKVVTDFLPEQKPPAYAPACHQADYADREVEFDRQGRLAARCVPPVLYSWAPSATLDMLRARLGQNPWPRLVDPEGHVPLYLARDPLSTFGYGSFDHAGGGALRVVVRPDVTYRFWGAGRAAPDCASLSRSVADSTVFVRMWFGANPTRDWGDFSVEEFLICSSAVIASWSTGTTQFYGELQRALARALEPGADFPTYQRYAGRPTLFGINPDDHPFSQLQLLNSLKKARAAHAEFHARVP